MNKELHSNSPNNEACSFSKKLKSKLGKIARFRVDFYKNSTPPPLPSSFDELLEIAPLVGPTQKEHPKSLDPARGGIKDNESWANGVEFALKNLY